MLAVAQIVAMRELTVGCKFKNYEALGPGSDTEEFTVLEIIPKGGKPTLPSCNPVMHAGPWLNLRDNFDRYRWGDLNSDNKVVVTYIPPAEEVIEYKPQGRFRDL